MDGACGKTGEKISVRERIADVLSAFFHHYVDRWGSDMVRACYVSRDAFYGIVGRRWQYALFPDRRWLVLRLESIQSRPLSLRRSRKYVALGRRSSDEPRHPVCR